MAGAARCGSASARVRLRGGRRGRGHAYFSACTPATAAHSTARAAAPAPSCACSRTPPADLRHDAARDLRDVLAQHIPICPKGTDAVPTRWGRAAAPALPGCCEGWQAAVAQRALGLLPHPGAGCAAPAAPPLPQQGAREVWGRLPLHHLLGEWGGVG